MGGFASIFSPPKPQAQAMPDLGAERRAAEAKAKQEADELKSQQEQEERAIRTGRRGRRSLLSEQGGELGFSNILGG